MDRAIGSREALRRAVARCWADDVAGLGVWTILSVNDAGFVYEVPACFGKRFQSWAEGHLWERYQGRGTALLAREQNDLVLHLDEKKISPNARCVGFSLVEDPGLPGQSSRGEAEQKASHGGPRFSEDYTRFLRRLRDCGDRFDGEDPEAT